MPEEKKQFSINDMEEKILAFWDTEKIFEKSLEKTKDGQPFTFYDGPPFATGLPHYGHILASTIKDLVPRYHTMKGHFVRRRWGWDCHGLPIEELIERKLGISGKKEIEKIGIKKFNETCRSMVLQYVEEWGKLVRRIARWIEFKNSYKTMDASYMESVWWAFAEMHKKKLVYEGRKVLLYCGRCETPISNFEVAMDNSYKDVDEESVYVKFKIAGEKNTFFLAWTTTPWTLPGNLALAVGKDIEYVEVEHQGETFILAKNLVSKIIPQGKEVRSLKGSALIGMTYEPLFDVPHMKSAKSYTVYDADFVTTDEGTGIVHTAVMYGEDDYQLGMKVGLPTVPMLDEKGIFNDVVPVFIRGKGFKESEKFIKKDLEERGLLFKRHNYKHSYPHCWRCGSALFYNAIPAWFVNIQNIKAKLVESNKKEINWFPEHLKYGRYQKSVEAAPDWNISRNRYWGNPIPVWKCDACEHQVVVGSIAEIDRYTSRGNTFTIMRHGEADNNVRDFCASGPEEGDHISYLTAVGEDQARRAAQSLKDKKISIIYASPYVRARKTAEIIAREIGATIIIDDRLGEIDAGIYRWKSVSEYHAFFKNRVEEPFYRAPEGGETWNDVRRRVMECIREIDARHHGEHIMFISHGDPLWLLESSLSMKDVHTIPYLKNCEAKEVRFFNVSYNDAGEIDMHRPYIDEVQWPCEQKGCAGTMKRTPEIFDSWMEAASMPFAEFHYPFENKKVFDARFPAQFVAEYIAQTRAWFYVMHVVSYILFQKAPFQNVVTTGTILAEDGSKMSKSKNNFPDPWLVIQKYGADSLRFYLMNAVVMQADNLNFSEKEVQEIYRKVILLTMNVYNYYATYVGQSDDSVPSEKDRLLDTWITIQTDALVRDVTQYFDAYDTVHATRAIQAYIDGLSTWYLRRSRKRKDKAFFDTTRNALMTLSRILAPVTPCISEELYQNLKGKDDVVSVHLTEWPVVKKGSKKDDEFLKQMDDVRRLASVVLGKRAMLALKVRQPLASLTLRDEVLKGSTGLLEILKDEVNVKEVLFDKKLGEEVVLDINITPELKEEGILREFIRTVQGLRQDAGYKPGEMMTLSIDAPPLKATLEKYEAALKKEISAQNIEWQRISTFDAELATKIDGVDVWLAIKK